MNNNATSTFSFTTYDILSSGSSVSATCSDTNAKMFVQYTCIQSVDQLATKRNQATIISCLAVFAVGVYLTVLHYFKRASDLNQMEWDMQTITPGDYTAQLEITEKSYRFFM